MPALVAAATAVAGPAAFPPLQTALGGVAVSLAMLYSQLLTVACSLSTTLGSPFSFGGTSTKSLRRQQSDGKTDLVKWDEDSVFINGKRVMLFNAEFHPYRLPVPALWLDIFQKLKAAGFSGVSYYVDWALLEGQPGNYTAEGIFAQEPFYEAAKKAGIYLVARPGPYINAESSGGGYPGWLQRNKAILRTPDYLPETANYVANIGKSIASAQITKGGPVILVQPENEYTQNTDRVPNFPDHQYFADVEKMFTDTGIEVPYVSNDASPRGNFAPGTGLGAVDIYGHDSYPLGFDCANPTQWGDGSLPGNFYSLHEQQSPTTPYTISEFQGGSFDPWGGEGFAKCTQLTGADFERVFYKNNYGAGLRIFNIYMGFGGTNWGNLGHPGGYTSYDYGAAIAEDRTVAREKYSETKLQANFLHASPAYLTAKGASAVQGAFVNTQDITTTQMKGNTTNFYIIRHSAYNTFDTTTYKLVVPTSKGNITVPQLGSNSLSLIGRDSKFHVTDYDVGGANLLYSSSEIFTWQKYADKTVLVMYGGEGETHEFAFSNRQQAAFVEGNGAEIATKDGSLVVNWQPSAKRQVIVVDKNLYVYLVDRKSAFSYWVLDLPASGSGTPYIDGKASTLIVNGGYLMRSGAVSGNDVQLVGDVNATTPIEVIGGAPRTATLYFNGQKLAQQSQQKTTGVLSGTVSFAKPSYSLPKLSGQTWKYLDTLPEIQNKYDDSAWTKADHTTTNNSDLWPLKTPTSLYSSDYGYNTGNLLYRGHFTAQGNESALSVTTQGGYAFASAIYLNNTLVSTFAGNADDDSHTHNVTLPKLTKGTPYVLTVVCDNMGLEEDFTVGSDTMKNPRGIIDYTFSTPVAWKLTGNLGGEAYRDRVRGPLNEGGLFAERMGFHQPNPPTAAWQAGSPFTGISKPGIGFWTTSFKLDLPQGYDIPLSFDFANSSAGAADYRVQLYVNGYQFGKFVNNVGPQTSFPVPQGVLNYNGDNTVALSLWGFDTAGNKLGGLNLVANSEILSGFGDVTPAPQPAYSPRAGAY